MMFESLTNKQQRYLAIELLVVVVLLVIWLFIAPLWKVQGEYAEQASDLRFQLSKYEQVISNKRVISNNKTELQTSLKEARLFHDNLAHGVVAAQVQNTIREIVEKSQGSLVSTRILPEKQEGQLTRLAINVRLTGDDLVLQQLLFDLEMARPLLLIEKLTVSSRKRSRRRNSGSVGAHNITLEIASYLMRDGA